MFGFSFYKLLVLVAVVAAVWYGFKFIGRLQDQREAERTLRAGAGRQARAAEDPGAAQAEEMMACPVCQAYVPARNATNCGRADCPY